uniref:Protein kinase domain-containing protein n=1 Tax=Urocitellus parryii TaxID=9999 RepID=A0A8D2I2U3_UROPR
MRNTLLGSSSRSTHLSLGKLRRNCFLVIVGDIYKLFWKIREGSFGDIYLVMIITNCEKVAVKLESQKIRHPQLYDSRLCKDFSSGTVLKKC